MPLPAALTIAVNSYPSSAVHGAPVGIRGHTRVRRSPLLWAEPHTTSHAGLRIELIPQPPVATRTSPVPQGEDHREGHVAERQEGEDAGNSAVDPPKEHLESPEEGNEREPE